ncbi:MAG: TSUP family transporter [Gammaproteobacteria bacterium]
MENLLPWQYAFIGLVFVWGGFVRSGLGFGGAALTMPLLLLVLDNPVHILPVIAVHLLFFGGLTVGTNLRHVDWLYLRRSLLVMMPGKIIGVFGLLSMPGHWLAIIVYVITAVYAVMYIVGKEFHSSSAWGDRIMLNVGSYISGTSLIGAPIIISIYARHVAKEQLRETLFMLWIILVLIKLGAFVATDTDLQLIHHLWLLPCAAVGHVLGLRLHRRLLEMDNRGFMRVLGFALLAITLAGAMNTLFNS